MDDDLRYLKAKNFFEVNMIKDYDSRKMQQITEKEVEFLIRKMGCKDSKILEIMCGYGRIANELIKKGYRNVSGIDIGKFDFLKVKKNFNFINMDFYKYGSLGDKYDYIYSIYNSYANYDELLQLIKSSEKIIKENGILIVDIFSKEWRDTLPGSQHRIVYSSNMVEVELFRRYDDGLETSIYQVYNKCTNEIYKYQFTQCMIDKDRLLKIIPEGWNFTLTTSKDEKTREDNQKHILILRKEGK